MMKKLLKAKDIERLENTSAVVLLPVADDSSSIWSPCGITCNEGACTGTAACVDAACTGTCGITCNDGACTGTKCYACYVTCVTGGNDVLQFEIIDPAV